MLSTERFLETTLIIDSILSRKLQSCIKIKHAAAYIIFHNQFYQPGSFNYETFLTEG